MNEEKVFTDYVLAAIAQGKLVNFMLAFSSVNARADDIDGNFTNVDDLKEAAKQCGIELPSSEEMKGIA